MKKTAQNIGLFTFSILCGFATGCSDKGNVTKIKPFPNDVVVAKPIIQDVELWNEYTSIIAPVERVDVRARVNGYLNSITFKKGDEVKAGDVIFEIDDRPFSIAFDAAKANVKAAESKISLAENNHKRAEALYKRNAVSEEMLQTRDTELLVAQAKLLEAKSNERNAKLNMEYTRVAAPISGKISETNLDVGNLVTAHSTLLAQIVRSDTVKVYFELNEADVVRYKNSGLLSDIKSSKGPKAVVTMENDNKPHEGNVGYFAPMLGNSTSSLKMCADIDNTDGELVVGAFAKIRVLEGSLKNCVLLPEEVIGTDLMVRYVIKVAQDGTAKYVPVKLGRTVGKMRIIESGVDANDDIVIVGLQRAIPGRKLAAKHGEIKQDVK